MTEPRHLGRLVAIWAVLTAVLLPLVIFVFNADLPPGRNADDAQGAVIDQTVLYAVAVPIALALIVFFAYVLIVFRAGASRGEGTAIPEDPRVGRIWLIVTATIAVGLAAFGTVRLLEGGAGGGQGPDPLVHPSGEAPLEVQVIGQQWDFTYRYPSYGGVETPQIVLPVDRQVEFHVTSLDVVHAFWAEELGVKADANPGEDNVAYVKPSETGDFQVHCAELCGLWHGHMYDTGHVVTDVEFRAWIARQQRKFAPATAALPPYSHVYFPAPERRAG